MSAEVGRDGWLCLEGKREGDREGGERCRRTGVLPYGTHLIAFHSVTPFPSPLPLLGVPLSISCHLFPGSDEDVCCC